METACCNQRVVCLPLSLLKTAPVNSEHTAPLYCPLAFNRKGRQRTQVGWSFFWELLDGDLYVGFSFFAAQAVQFFTAGKKRQWGGKKHAEEACRCIKMSNGGEENVEHSTKERGRSKQWILHLKKGARSCNRRFLFFFFFKCAFLRQSDEGAPLLKKTSPLQKRPPPSNPWSYHFFFYSLPLLQLSLLSSQSICGQIVWAQAGVRADPIDMHPLQLPRPHGHSAMLESTPTKTWPVDVDWERLAWPQTTERVTTAGQQGLSSGLKPSQRVPTERWNLRCPLFLCTHWFVPFSLFYWCLSCVTVG